MESEEQVSGIQTQAKGGRRNGEKWGWTGGLTGGFIWVLVLAIMRFAQGFIADAVIAVAIFILAMALIFLLAPWRHPATRYFVLLLPIFAVFLSAFVWLIWTFGGLQQSGLRVWHLLFLLPCFTPLFTIGARRWRDYNDSE